MRTITKFAAAMAVAVPLLAATGTAQAANTSTSWSITIGSGYTDARWGHNDNYHYRHRALSPQAIRNHLRRSYYEVSRPERRGDVYIARAEDRRGRDLRIVADAYTGRVLNVEYTRRDHDRRDDRRDRRRR